MHGIGNGPANLDHSSIWQMIQFLYLCPKKATKQAPSKGELQTLAPKDKKQSKEELVDVMLRLELLTFLIKLRQDNTAINEKYRPLTQRVDVERALTEAALEIEIQTRPGHMKIDDQFAALYRVLGLRRYEIQTTDGGPQRGKNYCVTADTKNAAPAIIQAVNEFFQVTGIRPERFFYLAKFETTIVAVARNPQFRRWLPSMDAIHETLVNPRTDGCLGHGMRPRTDEQPDQLAATVMRFIGVGIRSDGWFERDVPFEQDMLVYILLTSTFATRDQYHSMAFCAEKAMSLQNFDPENMTPASVMSARMSATQLLNAMPKSVMDPFGAPGGGKTGSRPKMLSDIRKEVDAVMSKAEKFIAKLEMFQKIEKARRTQIEDECFTQVAIAKTFVHDACFTAIPKV